MNRVYLSPPHVGAEERRLLLEAFESNWIAPVGPHLDRFEQEFAERLGLPGAVALSSGTAALHLALHIIGVSSEDEVLTSTLTFAATANAITYLGARPVFLDSTADTWTMDPALLEEELEACARRGRLPRAVMAVDLYGQCADYKKLVGACRKYEVPLIADASEALGATYRGEQAGRFGEMAAFSFNGNKIITSGGGGMLVSNRVEWLTRARYLATQARDPAPHYQHSEIGFNYRMSNLLAAVGLGQLRNLDQHLAQRRANNDYYRRQFASLPGIDVMPEASYGRSNCWLTCITVDPARVGATREDLRQQLELCDIESRPVWKPMHLQPAFAGCRVRGGSISARLFERGLCLPSGSSLTQQERERVVDAIEMWREWGSSRQDRTPLTVNP
ncbi:MAG: aminotransferase class I/II-fold pyridoxal phosphate-dependent enzyme [Acidobacteria bacterium]|nr:MAG: aminotransferase class I/II-fold pyridoxal phosphate-dependent enzyme [Acidobacteriota bacterium]